MSKLKGFLSYARTDNLAERGRIRQLAEHIQQEYQLITGDEVHLFVDEEDIEWGEDWKQAIDTSLSDVAFFIPIITPTYFQRGECRRELQTFLSRANQTGLSSLILPIYYVNVKGMRDGTSNDDLVLRTNELQAFDWQQLRFADINSSEYRRGIAEVVERLISANAIPDLPQVLEPQSETVLIPVESDDELGQLEVLANSEAVTEEVVAITNHVRNAITEDDKLGQLEILANSEEEFEELPKTLNAITEEMGTITNYVRNATIEMEKAEKGPKISSRKLLIANKLAIELRPSIEAIWSLANKYSESLISIDQGYRLLIENAAKEDIMLPDTREKICQFFASVRVLVTNAHEANINIRKMADATSLLLGLSRSLRPVLGQLISGLNVILDTEHFYNEWLEQIDRTNISCE